MSRSRWFVNAGAKIRRWLTVKINQSHYRQSGCYTVLALTDDGRLLQPTEVQALPMQRVSGRIDLQGR